MPHRSLPCPQDLAGPVETDDQVWPRQVPLYSKTSRRDFDSAVAAFGIRALACCWNCCFFLVADVANHSGSQSRAVRRNDPRQFSSSGILPRLAQLLFGPCHLSDNSLWFGRWHVGRMARCGKKVTAV